MTKKKKTVRRVAAANKPKTFEQQVGEVLVKFVRRIIEIDEDNGSNICRDVREVLQKASEELSGKPLTTPEPGTKFTWRNREYLIFKDVEGDLSALDLATAKDAEWDRYDVRARFRESQEAT